MTLPLQLSGTVNAGAELTLASQRLSFAYVIDTLRVTFPSGSDHLVRVTPMLCFDDSRSTSGHPPGNFLLSFCSPDVYLLGDDTTIELPMNLIVGSRGTWLKCHLENADAFVHRISAVFALRELLQESI